MRACRDHARQLVVPAISREMRAHGLCVGMWHDQSGRFSPFRADGAENVAPDIAGVARGTGACSTLGPDTGERASCWVLPSPSPRFILKPYLSRALAAGCFRQGCFYLCGEVFLKASCASGSDFGCCGRADRRFESGLPGLPIGVCQQFAHRMVTPKRSSIDPGLRFRSTPPLQRTLALRPHAVSGSCRMRFAQMPFQRQLLLLCRANQQTGLEFLGNRHCRRRSFSLKQAQSHRRTLSH